MTSHSPGWIYWGHQKIHQYKNSDEKRKQSGKNALVPIVAIVIVYLFNMGRERKLRIMFPEKWEVIIGYQKHLFPMAMLVATTNNKLCSNQSQATMVVLDQIRPENKQWCGHHPGHKQKQHSTCVKEKWKQQSIATGETARKSNKNSNQAWTALNLCNKAGHLVQVTGPKTTYWTWMANKKKLCNRKQIQQSATC